MLYVMRVYSLWSRHTTKMKMNENKKKTGRKLIHFHWIERLVVYGWMGLDLPHRFELGEQSLKGSVR